MTAPICGTFFLEGADFFHLGQHEESTVTFKIGSHAIPLTLEQAVLLSNSFLNQYQSSRKHVFVISPPRMIGSESDFVDAMKLLSSIFTTNSCINIDSSNVGIFSALAGILDNKSLGQVCQSIPVPENRIFSLSSARFLDFSPNDLAFLNNFQITLMNKSYQTNRAFFNTLVSSGLDLSKPLSIANVNTQDIASFLSCFESFLNVLSGFSVRLDRFDVSILEVLQDVFHIDYKSKCEKLSSDLWSLIETAMEIIHKVPRSPDFAEKLNFIAIHFASVPKKMITDLPEDLLIELMSSNLLYHPCTLR